jgi:outer membrane protein W
MFNTNKNKTWAFGPSFGAQWNFYNNKITPYVGIGITKIIFKF